MDNVNSLQFRGNVPFSWENRPGLSKTSLHVSIPAEKSEDKFLPCLPSPPISCSSASGEIVTRSQSYQIPPPPCPSQTCKYYYRSASSKNRVRIKDDPFLVAYKECTKSCTSSGKDDDLNNKNSGGNGKPERTRKIFFFLSCKSKRACSVRDDNSLRNSGVSKAQNTFRNN